MGSANGVPNGVPLAHPAAVAPDVKADDRTERIMMGIVPRGIIWLGNKLPRFCRPLLTLAGRLVRSIAPFSFEL